MPFSGRYGQTFDPLNVEPAILREVCHAFDPLNFELGILREEWSDI